MKKTQRQPDHGALTLWRLLSPPLLLVMVINNLYVSKKVLL